MKVIWKSILDPQAQQSITVPDGAEMLCVMEQFDQICIWYRCDPNAPKVARFMAIVGTGHPAPDGEYIGSASLSGGQLIFHVFEVER